MKERPKEEDSKERKHREITDRKVHHGSAYDPLPFSLQPKRYAVLIRDFCRMASGTAAALQGPPP
jgi:hypothetical protein